MCEQLFIESICFLERAACTPEFFHAPLNYLTHCFPYLVARNFPARVLPVFEYIDALLRTNHKNLTSKAHQQIIEKSLLRSESRRLLTFRNVFRIVLLEFHYECAHIQYVIFIWSLKTSRIFKPDTLLNSQGGCVYVLRLNVRRLFFALPTCFLPGMLVEVLPRFPRR